MSKFTKEAFVAWLEEFSPREWVGRPEHQVDCPLCHFLKAQGAKTVWMHFNEKRVNGKSSSNPRWASQFQVAACNYVADVDTRITAKTALSFLK
jgi:hypothetical protein